MNPEINRKFIEIRDKCSKAHPEKYPDYCWRAVLDMLDLLNDIREETASTQNQIDNLSFLNNFVQAEEVYPR